MLELAVFCARDHGVCMFNTDLCAGSIFLNKVGTPHASTHCVMFLFKLIVLVRKAHCVVTLITLPWISSSDYCVRILQYGIMVFFYHQIISSLSSYVLIIERYTYKYF